jgi:peroxiredoxin
MTKTTILSMLAAAGVAFGGASLSLAQPAGTKEAPKTAQPDKSHKDADKGDKKHEDKADKKAEAKIGEMAPDFTLTDTDGKTVKLSDFKGKTVVLEWFNPECPFVLKHHQKFHTFNDLYTQYNSKNVQFLAINSSAAGMQGAGKDMNKTKKEEFKMQYPVLLDEAGTVGHMYGSKNTPTCFVIDKDGKLVYRGAIDNNDSPDKAGDKNYVKMALDEVLAGKTVTESSTKAYGCGVKYAK